MRVSRTLLVACACIATAACARAPTLDRTFGNTAREVQARQVMNPGASSTDPVAGIDGRSGREAYINYVDTFKTPPPPVAVFTFGVSGTQGGGR